MNFTQKVLAVTTCLAIGSVCHAQINVLSRVTTFHYNWVHGGGPDTHTADQIFEYNSNLMSDSHSINATDHAEGTWFTHWWNTDVWADLSQTYNMTNSYGKVSRILADLSAHTKTTAFGTIPTANSLTTNPGNSLEIHFKPAKPCKFNLSGSVLGGSSIGAYVILQRFNGFNWEYLFASFFTPGDDVTFNQNGVLLMGSEYRLIAAVDSIARENQELTKTGSFDFKITSNLEAVLKG